MKAKAKDSDLDGPLPLPLQATASQSRRTQNVPEATGFQENQTEFPLAFSCHGMTNHSESEATNDALFTPTVNNSYSVTRFTTTPNVQLLWEVYVGHAMHPIHMQASKPVRSASDRF